MFKLLADDKANYDRILQKAAAEAQAFLAGLDARAPGLNIGAPHKAAMLPKQGVGAERALDEFRERFIDRLSGSAGPRYFGFITGGGTPAAVAGDWLVSVVDQNVHTSDEGCAQHIELETIALLRELFGLPADFHGSFVSGATMASFVGLATARQKLASDAGVDVAADGLWQAPPIKVLSGTAHSSIFKCLSMLGMGRSSLEEIPSLAGREAIDVAQLEQRLGSLQGQVCIVVASAGTVNTVDFDDLRALGELRRKYGFWLHIDGAFGAFAACSPQHAHLVEGMEFADSITIDAHKWLNVPYDCAMQFTRHLGVQMDVFRNTAAYLGRPVMESWNYVHLTPENSRRFRALPVWMSLMAYGSEGYREIVERNCELARALEIRLSGDSDFQVLAPVSMNVVCFTLSDADKQQDIGGYLKRLRDDGRTYLSPTVYKGTPGIRAAITNWRTESQDIDITFKALQDALEATNAES